LSDRLVTGLRAADTPPSWFWDPRIGKYVGYSREWARFAEGRPIRMASYNESPNLYEWSGMQIALEPDEADFTAMPRPMVEPARMQVHRETWVPQQPRPAVGRQEPAGANPIDDQVPLPGAPMDVYGPGVVKYEGVYLALMSVFHHWDFSKPHPWPDTADGQLAVSRDGRHFFRPGGRQPFLGVGPAGSFDAKWVWPVPRPVEMGDELWIYYYGGNRDHSMRLDAAAKQHLDGIGRAVMRLDGFVSADFAYTGGSLITPPLLFEGSQLQLNLDTGAGGMGRVELLDQGGAPIAGYTMADADTLNGNSVRAVVTWRGRSDVSALRGKPVRLHLKMRSAKLYAFQFK
jgi:hypothetical protein